MRGRFASSNQRQSRLQNMGPQRTWSGELKREADGGLAPSNYGYNLDVIERKQR